MYNIENVSNSLPPSLFLFEWGGMNLKIFTPVLLLFTVKPESEEFDRGERH